MGVVIAVQSQEADDSDRVPSCDVARLETAINEGGTLELDGNCLYRIDRDLPPLNRSLVLAGNGATLQIEGERRAFVVLPSGSLTLSKVTIRDGFASNGGALLVEGGTAAISRTSFVENDAAASGGAIHLQSGTLILSHTTFGHNSAAVGGALSVAGGTAVVNFSTFSQNEATAGGGGGIAVQNGDLTIGRSIVSGNLAASFEDDISLEGPGQVLSSGYNLFGVNSLPGPATTDLLGEPARLGPLENGLFVPDLESAARNAVPLAECGAEIDQRGGQRPQGNGCDIGAVEVQ
jgi:hypothetical protein